ncbi:MAG TPA: sugar phosphate isomerase/epimerase [Fimbriimonadaceae bacterium]|nr:sugar phosphate isomerase/epimerase [Fimbriimonadaceae bacterium]
MKLGVQCYTLRSEFQKDARNTFRQIADIGIRYIELAGLYDESPETIRGWLDDYGLDVVGSHVGLDRLEGDLPGLIEENRVLRNRYVVLPWVSREDYRLGWSAFGQRLESIAKRLQDAGLEFAYHNHAFEFESEGGRPGLDVLFDTTDPNLVKAEIDTAWVHHGGQDPAGYIRKLAGRVPLVHLKDITDNPDFLDVEAGGGVLDWDSILAACREAGVEAGVIELDECPGPPFESVRLSLEFFRGKGVG